MWNGNLREAFRSVRLSKWRSFFTMLGIVIGISSVVTVISLGEGLKHQIVGQVNDLGKDIITVRSGRLVNGGVNGGISGVNVLAFFNTSTLTTNDVDKIGQLPSVSGVVPIDFLTSSVTSGSKQANNLFVIGTNDQLAGVLHQQVNYGTFLNDNSVDQNYVVIGAGVATQLFGELNPIGQSLTIMGKSFVVQGVLAPSSGGLLSVAETDFNSAVFIPLITAQTLANGNTNLLQILVKAKDPNNLDPTVNAVSSTLLQTHHGQQDFTVLKQYQLLSIADDIASNLTDFISGIAAISLLVGGIGIMDIMLVSVSERTREIGIRKAVGATNRQILNQFLVEGLVLSVGGGLIGVAVSMVIYAILHFYTSLHPLITVPVVLLGVGVSVAVGIVFSVAPAFKAARKSPIEALRNE